MKYIISGSRGLIGEKLKQALDKKHKCILEIDQRCGSNVLSLAAYQLTPSTQRTDIFFHLAAFCKINEATKNPSLAHFNNAYGTFQALEFCRKNNIKKFVYFSTSRILSKERNPYVASKIYGEELCQAYYDCYGIEFVIVRPSTVYGEHHDLTTRLLTKWTINALKNEPLTLYGNEQKTLDFTHVDDFVNGILILIKKWDQVKNQAYDICGEEETKLMDVADILGGTVIFEKPEIAQPQQVKIDISKMKELGFKPKIKLKEGIKRLIKFYEGEGKKWIN